MTEVPGEEISLRSIANALWRQRVWVFSLPLVFGALALIYGFFIAEPQYASTATVNVAPVQVQAQLEGRIQVQGQSPLSFQALRAIAYSEEVVREVWETLRREGKLPTAWQDQGGTPGLERMVKDFKIQEETPRQQVVPQGQVPPVVASLTVQAPAPEVAARAANLWAEAVVKRVNAIPTARLQASLLALEEQIAPAERAYQEAQARWEAFQRTTALAQDKAELEAKTGERVSLDQELSGLERDLAAVQGRIGSLEAEVRRQAALVPVGTSPEQLAIMGRRLKEAQENLRREAERAQQSYLQASQALERFKAQERIPVWQAELNAYTEGYASAQARLLAIQKDLTNNETRLREARQRFEEYKAQLPSLALENLAAGLTVGEAEALVAERLREADARVKAAEAAWQAYQGESRLNVLKRQLEGFAERAASIRQRLERIPTERAVLQRRLAEAEAELAKEAKLLALEREVVADPVVAAALAQGGDLQALVGLRLKNQELNPTHQKLLFTALDLRAGLAALDREEEALRDEEARLQPQVASLQERIAEEEAKRSRLSLELDVARDIYAAVYRYAENLKRLAAKPEMKLREVNPDVLRFRDQIVGLEGEKAALEAEREALQGNLQEYDRRIRTLKAQIGGQERAREAILLEYNSKKAAYEAFRSRYDQIAKLAAQDLAFDNPNPEYQRLRSVLIDARAEEARLLARKAALEVRKAQVEARINLLKERVAKAQVEQDRVQQALELAKNAYLALSQKRTDLQIELASSEGSLAQVIAPAYPVYEKVAPRRALILALAVSLGLMLGVVAAFVAEALRAPKPEAAAG